MQCSIPVVLCSSSDGRQEGRLIAFAISSSHETEAAFAWSCSNLFHSMDTIILIHVNAGDSLFNSQSQERGLMLLDHYRSICEQKGFDCETVHADDSKGSAASVIAEITQSRMCDLCVCGSRGPNALKRLVFESVSSQIEKLCQCPVMIIKKPRDEAGAFLQVLPRRVFFYVEPDNSSHAFQWGLDKLLDPQTDEVYLLANFSVTSNKTGAHDETRVQMEAAMADFEEECRDRGISSVSRFSVTSTAQMLRTAHANSCDTLVFGRAPPLPSGKSSDKTAGSLRSAHRGAFPLIVVNHSPEARQHTYCSSAMGSLHSRASVRDLTSLECSSAVGSLQHSRPSARDLTSLECPRSRILRRRSGDGDLHRAASVGLEDTQSCGTDESEGLEVKGRNSERMSDEGAEEAKELSTNVEAIEEGPSQISELARSVSAAALGCLAETCTMQAPYLNSCLLAIVVIGRCSALSGLSLPSGFLSASGRVGGGLPINRLGLASAA